MAFKQKGFNPGVGTNMGNAFSSSPNKVKGRVKPRPIKPSAKDEFSPNRAMKEKYSPNRAAKAKTPNKKMTAEEGKEAYIAKIKARVAELRERGESEAGIKRYMESEMKRMKEGKADYVKHQVGAKGPGTYVKEGGSVKTSMKDLPIGSAERKAEYDRRGWAYDDTITGKKKENKPETDPTPDPTKVNNPSAVKPNVGELTDPEYMRSSKKGRRTTTVVRKDDKIATDEYTDRNIGDKRVRTYTGDPRGDMRLKEKFDKKGNKKKEKKKITLADGTVIKEKTTRGGKKKVKIRKKGQLFARKVKDSPNKAMQGPTNTSVVDGTTGKVKFTTKDMKKNSKETKVNYSKRKKALMGVTKEMADKKRGTGEGINTDALNVIQKGGDLVQRHKKK